jgi:hypothetical protein
LLSTAESKFWLDVLATVSFTRAARIFTPIHIAYFAEITKHIYPILGHVCAEMGHFGKSRKLECSVKLCASGGVSPPGSVATPPEFRMNRMNGKA